MGRDSLPLDGVEKEKRNGLPPSYGGIGVASIILSSPRMG